MSWSLRDLAAMLRRRRQEATATGQWRDQTGRWTNPARQVEDHIGLDYEDDEEPGLSPDVQLTDEQIAAAQLRIEVDRKLGRPTPQVVRDIANQGPTKPSAAQAPNTPPWAQAVHPDDEPVRNRARVIPDAAVARLAVYLRILSGLAEQGIVGVSTDALATAAGVNPATLRKDLSYVGAYGTRGVGYQVSVLIEQIERILGLSRKDSVSVTGIAHLDHPLGLARLGRDTGLAVFDLATGAYLGWSATRHRNPDVVDDLNLAVSLTDAGRYDEALSALEKAAAVVKEQRSQAESGPAD